MAHVDHANTLMKICEITGQSYTAEEIGQLISIGEKGINNLLDASIAHFYAEHIFSRSTPHQLEAWRQFMLGKDRAEMKKPEINMEIYQNAMFVKALLCSKHAPFGLLRRNIFRGARVLDIGGGLGFFSALFKLFGAKPTLCDKPEVESLVSPNFKKAIKTTFKPFPSSITQSNSWNCIHMAEVLHGRSKEEREQWLTEDIPNALAKDGSLIITDVDPASQTLYGKLFSQRIKLMTDGIGSSISAQDVFMITNKRFRIAAVVSWHSLPYWTAILKKTQ